MMAKYPQNFAGIHPTGQNTHEWFYFDSWNKMNGWDPQTRESFRTYLGDPKAEVPSYEERRAHSRDFLLDPQTQARCIAFNRFQQQEMTDFVAELAQTCRRHTEGRKLVIFFYGYAWEFSSHRFGPANSGHYGLENLLAKGFTDFSKAAAIKLSADGSQVFCSNRGHDSITVFNVDEATGKMEFLNNAKLHGQFPRDFEFFPGGKFCMVGLKESWRLASYAYDAAKGSFDLVSSQEGIFRPLYFKFKTT